MNKVLVDTNIFIYGMDNSSAFYSMANQVLSNENVELVTSSKNISEFFAVCTKLKINAQKIHEFYEDIKENVQILYPSSGSLTYFESLLKKYNPIGNQVFDIEIISIMLHHNIDCVATLNNKDFQNISEIKIVPL